MVRLEANMWQELKHTQKARLSQNEEKTYFKNSSFVNFSPKKLQWNEGCCKEMKKIYLLSEKEKEEREKND